VKAYTGLRRGPLTLRPGMRVEVVTHFTGAWVAGYEIESMDEQGCHIRRSSDGALLPVEFAYSLVRPEVE
jgi:hypothetical protein